MKRYFYKLALAILLIAPQVTFAACDPDKEICNPITANDLPTFIKTGLPVIALAIVYSGFLFVEARGNAEKLNKAKKALLYTMVGAAILLGSWAIAKLISETVLAL